MTLIRFKVNTVKSKMTKINLIHIKTTHAKNILSPTLLFTIFWM